MSEVMTSLSLEPTGVFTQHNDDDNNNNSTMIGRMRIMVTEKKEI